jgi:hypothetical protein
MLHQRGKKRGRRRVGRGAHDDSVPDAKTSPKPWFTSSEWFSTASAR